MAGMAQQQHPQQHGAAAAAVECGSSPSSCVTADAGGQEARSSNSGGFHRGTSNGGGGAGTGAGAGAKKACGGNGLVALHHHQQQLHHHQQLQQQMASTTFVEADTSSFRELVQRLTGVAEDAAEKLPITLPSRHASREQREAMAAMYSGSSHFGSPREGLALMAPRSSSSNGNGGSHGQQQQEAAAAYAAVNWEKMIAGRNLPGGLNGLIDASAYNNSSSSSSRGGIMNPGAVSGAGVSNTGTSFTPIATTKAAVEPLAVRRSAFKMPVGKKLELKQGSSSLRRDAVANAIFPNYHYWTTTGSGPGSSSSPRSAASPVTTLTRLPFESAHHLCSSAGSSVTSVSPRFGHDARYDGGGGGFSPRTPGSPYATPGTPTGFNIIDKRTRSLVHDVAHEFAGCNMADPAACSAAAAVPLPVPVPVPVRNGGSGGGSILQHSLLQRREEEEEEEYVVHPPLERRNGGQPQLLALFPMHSSSLKD